MTKNGAVGYARVSTDDQSRENNSLAVQSDKIARRCADDGVPLLKVFSASESARTTERQGLRDALAYCRQNRRNVTHFVVADLSRLARNARDQADLFVQMKQMGIELVSVDDPVTDDSAVGTLAKNMLGAFNQFFSDSLSERTRDRMAAAAKAGRFLGKAPIGYINKNKRIHPDAVRAPLVRQAFELMASGRFSTSDAVRKLVTTMGLTTGKGGRLTPQSFGRMITNPIYAGWVVTGEIRVRGVHEPIISDELFEAVQERINGKAVPHKQLNESFPLRGLVRCAACNRTLTAGFAKGRSEHYPRYWCWTKGCRAVGVSRDELEKHFVLLLALLKPTAELLAMLPELIAQRWKERKQKIADDAARLATKLGEQKSLNQRAVRARMTGEITQADFDLLKTEIADETERISEQIKALDSERDTMEELIRQAEIEAVDLVGAWKKSNVYQRQELVRGFFADGLVFSHKNGFIEPANTLLIEMFMRGLKEAATVGVPDGI